MDAEKSVRDELGGEETVFPPAADESLRLQMKSRWNIGGAQRGTAAVNVNCVPMNVVLAQTLVFKFADDTAAELHATKCQAGGFPTAACEMSFVHLPVMHPLADPGGGI